MGASGCGNSSTNKAQNVALVRERRGADVGGADFEGHKALKPNHHVRWCFEWKRIGILTSHHGQATLLSRHHSQAFDRRGNGN